MIFKTELRGTDKFGSGEFGAKRGKRLHRGLDIRCFEGQKVYSPIAGVITKIGFPYKQTDIKRKHFRYIEISVTESLQIRIFYVCPDVEKGNSVIIDELIGVQQELGKVYEGIKEHIHLEIIINGKRVNPLGFYKRRCLI